MPVERTEINFTIFTVHIQFPKNKNKNQFVDDDEEEREKEKKN